MRDVAEEVLDCRYVLDSWLAETAFPVDNGSLTDPKTLTSFFLGQSQPKPLFPEVLPQGLGLKVSFLWFQCLKSNRPELQKSNATLSLRFSRALQRQMPVHA